MTIRIGTAGWSIPQEHAGRFPDLIEVDAASRTKVDDTRELLDNVQYAPTRGRYKVYLIDEVHMLSKAAFNSMLKTLEEPPEHVKFVLATTDPQKIPVTVLSRCLQFNLRRLEETQIGALLTMRDAESVRRIEDEIEMSRRLSASSRITRGVAHEVKNPLAGIRGAAISHGFAHHRVA